MYLSTQFDRIPIVPSLSGLAHSEGGPIPLSAFYNLTHLARVLGRPVLEWDQVQEAGVDLRPDLGCWRTVERGGGAEALRDQGVEPSFWPVPRQYADPPTFAKLAVFVQDKVARESAIAAEWEKHVPIREGDDDDAGNEDNEIFKVPHSQRHSEAGEEHDDQADIPTHEPDQHLICFDQLLRTWESTFTNGEPNPSEALQDLDPLGPTWLEVGQHLHWNDLLLDVADDLLAHALASRPGRRHRRGEPYIAVHLRQGDFILQGKAREGWVEPYEAAVGEIQARLVEERGRSWRGLPVVFATDSADRSFVDALKALGWCHLDHEAWGTEDKWGGWHPGHLDLAVLSGASGFVG